MTYVFFFLFWLMSAPAQAGAPPPNEIPWDTVWVTDTVYTRDGPVVMDFVVEFITREVYERDVLEWKSMPALRETQRDLRIIKNLIRAKKAAEKP